MQLGIAADFRKVFRGQAEKFFFYPFLLIKLDGNLSYQDILTQLRTIFDLIIQFESAQDKFYQAANEELEVRRRYEQIRQKRTNQVCWKLFARDSLCSHKIYIYFFFGGSLNSTFFFY